MALSFTALLLAALCASLPASAQTTRHWNFRVYLDDSVIGQHRYTLREQGGERQLKSETRLEVKILFVTVYRYVHEATETWRGDCLASLSSRTDRNGEKLAVSTAREGDRLVVITGRGREAIDGCVMTFAYWNPEVLRRPRLLNSQTGEHEAVRVTALGEETILLRGAQVSARSYRITGSEEPTVIWYSAQQEWLARESIVEGGRRLRYVLDY